MPDEKNGDELFEDLDKFFAPIRDVDWDEPEEQAAVTPAEEHVSVRTEHAPPADPQQAEPAAAEPTRSEGTPEDEGAWYDTGQLEQIDEILGEPDLPEVVTLGEVDEPVEPIADEPIAEPAGEATQGVPSVWEEPPAAYDEGVVVRAPSDEELQAAAEHFAGSIGRDDTYPTEPVDVFAGEGGGGGDLLSDLGAEEVEQELLSDIDEPATPRTVVVGGEGISGPSWQEPAAVEVGAEIDRRGPSGDRDVPAAFMTGLGLAAVAVVSLWAGPAYFAAFAGLARARRPGRALRGAGQASRAAGVAGRARGRRPDDARRLLARRGRHACDVRARSRRRVPVVHDRAHRSASARRARPRDDGAQHGVDPAARRLPDRHLEAARRRRARPVGDRAHVPVRHHRVPGGFDLGRRVDPATARAQREPEEVVGRHHHRRGIHDARVRRPRHVVRQRVRAPAARGAWPSAS